ncbi:MAG TPA: prepilin-type N-terminal cleavage/methylation domain-containing protein [Candidatus Acidoferrum sp.]|nr:prepilin-type N-terminal cleavage/methylation domain-containing protein [Candidatus Acidoferrum sp.]
MKLHTSRQICSRYRKSQAGISLIETMIALALLLIAAAGIMTMATVAMSTTETQGHLAARTAEYAQDKMEQLLALQYADQKTDTTVFPSVVAAGTGLVPGGGLNPQAPVAGYSDYVDRNGSPVPAGANWQYVRVWQITENVALQLKTITVTTQVRHAVGQSQAGLLPTSTITCLKSSPF